MKSIIALLPVLLVLNTSLSAQNAKLTNEAANYIENAYNDEPLKLWIYFDSTALDMTAPALSEKSIERRNKVDPYNSLIDSNDFPIKKELIEQIKQYAKIRNEIRWFSAVTVETDKSGVEKIRALKSVQKIDKIHSFTRSKPIGTKQDDKASNNNKSTAYDYGQAEFQNTFINSIKLHQSGFTGKGLTIAMFDTGFRTDFPVFDSIDIAGTYDFINHDTAVGELDCPDEFSHNHQTFHGTATLSVIAANLPGVMVGAAPNATFLLAKTEISCSNVEINIEEDNWIAAAIWADSAGADIISSSLGYLTFDSGETRQYTQSDLDGKTTLITLAAELAASKNILVVNSAGNERSTSWGTIIAPSDGDSVIAVGAVNSDSTLASFSSPGPTADGRIKPDITSLGVQVIAQSHLGGLLSINGTSFSAPLVAAGSALAMEHDPALTADDIRNLIKMSGDRKDNPDNNYGYGIFDAVKTADIIKFDQPHDLVLNREGTPSFEITTSGTTDSSVVISAVSLPNWLMLTDYGDGTALIEVTELPGQAQTVPLKLTADVGYFADTADFSVTIRTEQDNPVTVGPNPFTDSVTIRVIISQEELNSLSIFNSAGEIVWEKVNNFTRYADVIKEAWNGRNLNGEKTAAGVYILVVSTNSRNFQVKLLKVDT